MLYQLSYASPCHPEMLRRSEIHTDTLPLRALDGTEIKVSIPPQGEQTGDAAGSGEALAVGSSRRPRKGGCLVKAAPRTGRRREPGGAGNRNGVNGVASFLRRNDKDLRRGTGLSFTPILKIHAAEPVQGEPVRPEPRRAALGRATLARSAPNWAARGVGFAARSVWLAAAGLRCRGCLP